MKKRNSPDYDLRQDIINYCCEKFLAEAEKIVAYVQSGKPIPDESYFTLRNYLAHLLNFNRPDDTDES